MAAAKQDLGKIGRDGFLLLEEFINNNKGKKPYAPKRQGPAPRNARRANLHQYQPEQNPLHLIKPKATAVEKMSTYEALIKSREEVSTAEFSIKNSAPMFY